MKNSLLIIIVLMCSCKTQKVDSDIKVRNDIRSDISYLNGSVKIGTQNHAYFANDTQHIIIEEDITVTEYDKETGKPSKETKTKRKTTQDSDKVSTEEENESVTECHGLEANHIVDKHEMVDADVDEESKGGQETFGKWLAISCVIAGILLYLWKR